MERIVIAILDDATRSSVADIITKSGMRVRAQVRSGADATRAIKDMGGGVVICSPRLLDISADALCERLGEEAYFLVVGHPAVLAQMDSEEIFKLMLPVKSSELIGSVRILSQLDERRMDEALRPKKKTVNDRAIVNEAKEYLTEERGMTEAEAHRFLQKRSMDLRVPVTEVARTILYHAE